MLARFDGINIIKEEFMTYCRINKMSLAVKEVDKLIEQYPAPQIREVLRYMANTIMNNPEYENGDVISAYNKAAEIYTFIGDTAMARTAKLNTAVYLILQTYGNEGEWYLRNAITICLEIGAYDELRSFAECTDDDKPSYYAPAPTWKFVEPADVVKQEAMLATA